MFAENPFMGGFERLSHHPWGIARPPKSLWMSGSGDTTFIIKWPYLPAAFVHDPTSHIADCACGCVGEVGITKPSCKLLGMSVIYTYKRQESEKNVPGVL